MSGRRRLLHVFSTFGPGGPQMRTARIMGAFPDRFEHVVVAMDGDTSCRERVPDGVALEVVPAPPKAGALRTARAMARLVRAVGPDLLLTYNWGAIETLLGAWTRRSPPCIHHEEGFGPEESERLLRRRSLMRRAVLPRASAVVVPSRRLEQVATEVWRQPAARVRYIPNGVDLERFHPPAEPPGGPLVIGSVGHLRPEKDHDLLLRAFARLRDRRDARLLIIGEGSQRARLEARARRLGLDGRALFLGARSDTDALYRRMHVYALSSRTEQMPLVVLEAMASGLPVVATDVGDVRAMVSEAGGPFIVPHGDPRALARALDAVLADAALRASLGAANRTRCERRFAEDRCLALYATLYEEAIAGRKRQPAQPDAAPAPAAP